MLRRRDRLHLLSRLVLMEEVHHVGETRSWPTFLSLDEDDSGLSRVMDARRWERQEKNALADAYQHGIS